MKSSMEQAFIHRSFHQLNHWGGSEEGRMSSLTLYFLPHVNKISIYHEAYWHLNWSVSHCTALYLKLQEYITLLL